MVILSIGDAVRAGTYRLHSRFRRAANYVRGHHLVSLVAPDIGSGPLNIVLPSPACAGDTLTLTPELLAGRRFRSGVSAAKPDRSRVTRNLDVLESVLVEEAHPKSLAFLLDERRVERFRSGFERASAEQMRRGVDRLFRVGRARCARRGARSRLRCASPSQGASALPQAIRLLAGCGFGLTPSGDDFLAGTLVAMNVFRASRRLIQSVCRAALGTNDLSNAFLRMARDGRMTQKQRALVLAVLRGSVAGVRTAARKVLQVGETSGADWATGFVVTARNGVLERWSTGVVWSGSPHHSTTPSPHHSRASGEVPP